MNASFVGMQKRKSKEAEKPRLSTRHSALGYGKI